MSFLVQNLTGGALLVNDLGLEIPAAGVGSPPSTGIFDLINESPRDVAVSLDLVSLIAGGSLIVLDPLDGTTALSIAQSTEIVQVHNDPHYRIRGGTLNQLDDVNISGSPLDLTNRVLQWNGVDAFEPITPDDLIGDASNAIANQVLTLLVDGTNTTVVSVGSPLSSIQVDVDDVFLMNTGDTLDSGTLTVASGASIVIATGGDLIITDPPTNPTDATNKAYVDSVAAGFDPKESVRGATVSALAGDGIPSTGSPPGQGTQIHLGGTTFIHDGVTYADGDRILVKDGISGSPGGDAFNGIYVVSGIGSDVVLTRAEDQNGAPAAEVSGGNFTFVEEGSVNADSGWVVSDPNGIANLDTDDISWTQFSGAGSFTGDIGIGQSGTTIAVDFSVAELPAAAAIALVDRIALHDIDGATQAPTSTQTYGATFQDIFNALDVPYSITGNGIVVQTADNTFATRTIAVDGVGNLDGLAVTNGDGIAGNPTLGLDIQNLPIQTAIDATDRIPVWDSTADANVYYTVNDVAGALSSVNSFETWSGAGNTTGDAAVVADSATDTVTITGGTGINIDLTAATDTLTWSIDFAALNSLSGSPISESIDLTDEIILNDGVEGVVSVTLQDLISGLGLAGDELVKVSANDTTAGFLNGKLVAGTYTTLVENLDGGNETLTVDVDLSAINLEDIGNVFEIGSPAPADGDVLVYQGVGSPIGWANVPSSSLSTVFNVCTLPVGTTTDLDLTDSLAVCNGGVTEQFTFLSILSELDVPNGVTGSGFVVKIETGSPPADSYVSRLIVASTTAAQEGIVVTDGDGVAGNPTVGVDINGQTNSADDLAATDEVLVYDGTNNVSMSGQQVADGVADILNLDGLSVANIGGSGSPAEMTLVLTDPNRGNKQLSITEWTIHWAEAQIGNNDWVQIGTATDALTGWIVPMDGTIVRVSGHCENANGNNKDLDLYINGTKNTDGFVNFNGSGEQTFTDIGVNTDVSAGDKLRLRGAEASGSIQDVVVNVWIKWRV